jgi:GH25 family lysozyme M1 (1,4-beta-N-acetylmuramidase)
MMTTRRAHGMDISQWQGEFQPTPETLVDVDFVILKVTQADNFLDPGFSFRNFYESALQIPIRGAYHFYRTRTYRTSELLSESSVPKKVLKGPKRTVTLPNGEKKEVPVGLIHVFEQKGPSWDAQAEFFLQTVTGKDFHFYALDIETGRDPGFFIGISQNIFTAADVQEIKLWIERVKSRTGKPVLLYTNQNIYNNMLLPRGGHILSSLDLWLAGYLDDPRRNEDDPLTEFPIKNPAVKNWHFWQYSADGNERGAEFGVTSRSIDLDVFNGPVETLRDWLGLAAVISEPEGDTEVKAIEHSDHEPETEIPTSDQGDTNDEAPVQEVETEEETQTQQGETGEEAPVDASVPTETVSEHPAEIAESPQPPDAITVEVAADKAVLRFLASTDKAGKPIMRIREPRVRLDTGSRLLVSASRSESDKDKGDGIIHATGNNLFYFVIDHPSNDLSTRNLYVRVEDVKTIG